ncbi:DUF4833 domain-containing protein [Foetidibacter luteolus]|uniref:DUF4833 domain-containing protein n=1 Tax=Foetidibacter luteolus TaxID=2608880 RepID=UPI00129B8604|nr:DUF4833 domain-containing protein [Foetidibacter luteolus]
MKNTTVKQLTLFIAGILVTGLVMAQEMVFPTPPPNPNQLFYLQRDPNTNTIVCELNYKDGILDEEDPVHVFWLRFGEKGQRAELNFVQRKFAYGVKTRLLEKDKYELHFVSYKKYLMHLMKAADNKYHVYATINKKQAILNRIFVRIKGGSFWTPHVEYVDLVGIDPVTGTEVTERMKI